MIVAKGFIFTMIHHYNFITAHTVKFDVNFSPFIELRIKRQWLYCNIYEEINYLKGSVKDVSM